MSRLLPTLYGRWSSIAVDSFKPVECVAPALSDLAASTPSSPDAWSIIGPSPMPLPTPSLSTPLLTLTPAGSESTVAIPAPTIAAVSPSLEESADYRNPTNLADAGSPCYYARRSQQGLESPRNPELMEFEDILYILDDFGLSHRQLWNYIKVVMATCDALVQETRQQASEGQTGLEASRVREPRPLNEAEPPVTVVVESSCQSHDFEWKIGQKLCFGPSEAWRSCISML
ncbi:hypothetical protein RhiJN_21150 [Ceratobasidium sp. AG-Ba]|nr:hypothetical protein RhiJN_21150 [Ceratobasidium sp. AG-Ba]